MCITGYLCFVSVERYGWPGCLGEGKCAKQIEDVCVLDVPALGDRELESPSAHLCSFQL